VLLVQFVGDAFVGVADAPGERRVRSTETARKRRNEAANRGPRVAIEGPQHQIGAYSFRGEDTLAERCKVSNQSTILESR